MSALTPVAMAPTLPIGQGGLVGQPAPAELVTLPTPTVSLDTISDMLSQLHALLSASRSESLHLSEASVRTNQLTRHEAEKAHDQAVQEAREEAESESFFEWITKDIGIVGLIGLLTLNPALVAVDLVAHKTGLVENLRLDIVDVAVVVFGGPALLAADILLRKLDVAPDCVRETLDDLGLGDSVPGISDQDVQPVVEKALMINLLLASAAITVLTAGTTTALVVGCIAIGLSCGSMVSASLGGPEELTLGLAIGGAVLSLGSGFLSSGATAGSALNARLSSLKVTSSILSGATGAIRGIDGVTHAIHTRNAEEATYRATEARQTLTRLERLFDTILQGLKDAKASAERTTALIQSTLETHNTTLRMTSAMLRV